ncbi:acyltransferase family protein [Jejuia pallidilutea]|uniref:Acetyltransferase n=1 Tax=Jejuia pallidilutea TaxID=504487 RepID=A0A090W427_9FLAO|nr:acyltransferase [Jejuia pallidilutea]GAL68311.1 acetyltransferase [Jejuia pallidilutea]GAL70214.1 acetyltransferase [Jejuia pallidilutea]GAL88833.1 acetyltransferase [Jejuia pallidilutea]
MNKINTNNFDFLRVVFASTVAIAHLIELSQINSFQPYLKFFNTRLAIDGFFIISGFLIAKSYESNKKLKVYIKKRIKRIVPAYFFVILLCAIFFSAVSTEAFSDYFFSKQFWRYLVANLSFQNYIEPCLPGVFEGNLTCAVNGALWTIKIEEAFYLLLPLFYYVIDSKKVNIYILSVSIYLVSVVYFSYFYYADMYSIAKQLPGALAFFITGVMYYRNFEFLIKWKHYFIIPCLVLFVLEQYVFSTYIFKPITYGFMVFYVAYNFKWLNNFGKYGDFTYGIYIYHFPLIQIFVHYNLFHDYNPILVSILLLFFVLIASVLSWYLLELQYLSENRKLRYKKLYRGLRYQ